MGIHIEFPGRAVISVEAALIRSCCVRFWRAFASDRASVGTKVWLAAGVTDLRRGFDGLSAQVQNGSSTAILRTRVCVSWPTGDIVKLLWWMATVCVCSPSVWSGGASSGRRRRGSCTSEPCTAIDASGRHRLASCRKNMDPGSRGLRTTGFPSIDAGFPRLHLLDLMAYCVHGSHSSAGSRYTR